MNVAPLRASLTRITDLDRSAFDVDPVPRERWQTGDYVLGEVRSPGVHSARLELTSGRVTDVSQGEGVVGEQPRLEPGETYTYSSGALMRTPTGSMAGSYEFVTDGGQAFKALIPEFVLAAPESLN